MSDEELEQDELEGTEDEDGEELGAAADEDEADDSDGEVTPASSGKSYEMYAIAAVVLGGVSMSGGKGNLLGVFFGALSYTTINFIIVSIPALTTDIQDTFQGLVLIAVILIQTVGPVIKERFVEARKRRASRKQTRIERAESKG